MSDEVDEPLWSPTRALSGALWERYFPHHDIGDYADDGYRLCLRGDELMLLEGDTPGRYVYRSRLRVRSGDLTALELSMAAPRHDEMPAAGSPGVSGERTCPSGWLRYVVVFLPRETTESLLDTWQHLDDQAEAKRNEGASRWRVWSWLKLRRLVNLLPLLFDAVIRVGALLKLVETFGKLRSR